MKLISVFALALLSTTAFSQSYKFEIGAQAGPNISSIRFENTFAQDKKQNQIAALGGLFLQYNLSNTFALHIDPTFERLQYKYKDITLTDHMGNMSGTIKSHVNFDYISIPVLFKASVGNKIRGFFNAGPSFNFLLQGKSITHMPIHIINIQRLCIND